MHRTKNKTKRYQFTILPQTRTSNAYSEYVGEEVKKENGAGDVTPPTPHAARLTNLL